jgi:arabinose-5-phosphate isomerase
MNETDSSRLLQVARQVIELESSALTAQADRLGDSFLRSLDLLSDCQGKIIVCGLGKSGIAAKKIAATLASTGAPALFLHAGEAVHGDMGVIAAGDCIIAISYSGETRELSDLIPRTKFLGVPVIAITGSSDSALASLSDCHLDVSVPKYEWPFGIIPTASNATTVAIGDALAIALLVKKGVGPEDFALLHPGGLLGRKVLMKVRDLMHSGDRLPVVISDRPMKEAIMEMTAKRLGAVCVVDHEGNLTGIITDGDLRRLLERSPDPFNLSASQAMTTNPKRVDTDVLAARALRLMEEHSITVLPVMEPDGRLAGIIHMHDIVKLETGS